MGCTTEGVEMANSPETACAGKKTYLNEELALKAEKIHLSKYSDSRMNHYKCKFCPYYHIGHRKGVKRQMDTHKTICPMGCGRLVADISLERHVDRCLPDLPIFMEVLRWVLN